MSLYLNNKRADLGVLPAEIWQIISTYLDFKDLSNLRLTNSALADIAAKSMVPNVRFDLSIESLERLRSIADHNQFRVGVKSLTLEAALIGHLCIHDYSAHYDNDVHQDIKPQPPPGNGRTPKAQRLYMRNLAKFNKELKVKYAKYRKIFDAQKQLLEGPKEHFFQSVDKFPNLQRITLGTSLCQHLLSRRFIDRYIQDCAIPLAIDPSQSPWQLQSMLRPGIKTLHAAHIALKFFNGEDGRSEQWLHSVFRELDSVSFQFNVSSKYGTVQEANYLYTIGCAKDLKQLTINFSTSLSMGHLYEIFPEGQSFSKLHFLDIECFTATEEEMMTTLKLQPALKWLYLSDVTLSTGGWRSLLKRMRNDLSLRSLYAAGKFKDATIELDTDNFSVDAWLDDEKIPLSVAIESYVVDSGDEDDDDEDLEDAWNPVTRVEDGDFAPYEELRSEYGPVSGDIDDDLDDDLIDSDSAEDASFDADDASMYSAHSTQGVINENEEDLWEDELSDVDADDMPDLVDATPPSSMNVD